MATRRRKKLHAIEFGIPEGQLGIKDATFVVRRDRELLGTLLVSRGAIEWVGANKQHQRKLDWESFSKLMLKKGRKRRKPGS